MTQGLPWWLRWSRICNAGDPGSLPGWGRSPGEENGKPLQYSCLENPMDRGAWRAPPQGHKESGMAEATEHRCMDDLGLVTPNPETFFGVTCLDPGMGQLVEMKSESANDHPASLGFAAHAWAI